MKKWFIHYIHALLLLKTWIKWLTAATLPLVGQCTAVLAVENSNSSPSGVTAASAPPVGISMPCSVLPLCPLNWLTSPTVTVFLPLTGISASFSLMTGHCLTASFMPWTVLFPKCFTSRTSPWISLPVLSWYSIPLEGIWSGIHISTALFLKAGTVTMVSGAISIISITLTCAMLSVPPCLMKWRQKSVLPLKK